MQARQLDPSNDPRISPERYLALERQADSKSEYWDGEVVAMTGASTPHGLILGNMFAGLHGQLRSRDCMVFPNDMRVRVSACIFTYPDIVAVCGDLQLVDDEHNDTILNPTVLIEVLSPSTGYIDRGRKLNAYRRIPTVQEYILVAQDEPYIQQYRRQTDELWLLQDVAGLDAMLYLSSIGCQLSMSDIYEKVMFPKTEDDNNGEI